MTALFAHAQDTPATAADAGAPEIDPPSRVGRLAALLGTVSFHTVDDTAWQAATLNYPVTSGNAFWTETQAGLEIEVGPTHLAMDQQTEFDVDTLDDQTFAATAPQGSVYLRLSDVQPGDTTSVTTPRGAVSITAAGRYEIVAGDVDQPTKVTVLDGAAEIAIGNVTLHVTPHQTASITGSSQDNFQGSVGSETDDAFLQAQLAKERPVPVKVSSTTVSTTVAYQPPPLVEKMTGYDSIRDTGEWAPSPQYGHVWYPPVARDWVPYRHGHWAFVAPWGWTWVDDAAWGFAPFHYGRWVQVQDRWGWIPVDTGTQVDMAVARPVYAPALVSFVDVGGAALAGAAVGLAAGLALRGNVGWIPLGPREAYVPPFSASPSYVRNVNVTHISNVTNITTVNNVTNNTTTVNNFVNRNAATVVPAAAMTNSQPVATQVRPVTPQALAAARPVTRSPVQPTAATVGYAPSVMHPAPAAPGATPVATAPVAVPLRPTSPGPAFAPHPAAAAMAVPATIAKPNAPAVPAVAGAIPAKPNPAAVAAPLPALKPAGATAPNTPAPATPSPVMAAPNVNAAPVALPAHPVLPSLRPAAGVVHGAPAPAPVAHSTTAAPSQKPMAAPAPATAPAVHAAPEPVPHPAVPAPVRPAPVPVKPQPSPAPAPAPVTHAVPAPAPHPATPAPAPHPATPAPAPHPATPPAPHPATAPAPHPATPPAPHPATASPEVHNVPAVPATPKPIAKPLPPLPHPIVKPCPNGASAC